MQTRVSPRVGPKTKRVFGQEWDDVKVSCLRKADRLPKDGFSVRVKGALQLPSNRHI